MIDVSKVDLTKVYDLSKKIVDFYKNNLEAMKINASGQLSRTADFDVEFNDYHMAVYFILESYYRYVEVGRNKSTGKFGTWSSKYADIERWLRNKIAKGSFIPSTGHTIPRTDKEIKRVAGAIVHKITKRGFYGYDHHGKHILERTLDEVEKAGILDSIIDEIVEAYSKKVDFEFSKI